MTVVTVKDGLSVGLCVSGQRKVCKALGISFRRLALEGIPVEELKHLDDRHVRMAIKAAEDRETSGG